MPDIKAQNETALASVKAIYDAADEANTLLDGMQTAATQAGTTLNGIYATAVQAEESATSAQASADSASEYASRALGNLASVQSVTETLNWITAHGTMTLTSDVALDPSHVYFVVDANGDYYVGGTYYSVVSEPVLADIGTYYELSINESLNNYVATHLVVDTEGLWIIPDSGGNKVLIATGSGSTYTTAGTYIVGSGGVVLASFTADGAQIGQDGESHLEMDYHAMQFVDKEGDVYFHVSDLRNTDGNIVETYEADGNTQGFTPSYYLQNLVEVLVDDVPKTSGTDYFVQDNTVYFVNDPVSGSIVTLIYETSAEDAPKAKAFTFGKRQMSGVGGLSFASGVDTIASGTCSHAEGYYTVASGEYSHAEGNGSRSTANAAHAEGFESVATDTEAHAEGWRTRASGGCSHSEGWRTVASGDCSHAQNSDTIAGYTNQTAIGKYNDNNSANAFEIGNGTSDSARSNALTVDWSGNVEASGDITDGNGNVLSDKADATALADYVLKATPYFDLDTTATTGTDYEICTALVSLGWDSDVIV